MAGDHRTANLSPAAGATVARRKRLEAGTDLRLGEGRVEFRPLAQVNGLFGRIS